MRMLQALMLGLLTLVYIQTVDAQQGAFEEEIVEWVVTPCMAVAAALDLPDIDKEGLDMGIKRDHIVKLMVASRTDATKNLVSNMDVNATWEVRAALYPLMLKMCLSGLPGMQ